MSQIIGILFSDFGPYHAARIEALNKCLSPESKLIAFRFSELSYTYSWKPVLPANIEVITLSSGKTSGIIRAYKIALKFKKMLRKNKINSIFLPSYSPMANLLCFFAAKFADCKTILMTDSWHGTEKPNKVKKLIKYVLIRLFDAALVAGTPHVKYVCSYGLSQDKVFLGYDIVDNKYFTEKSKYWRSTSRDQANILKLPTRFFLSLGRFIKKKNLLTLVKAYIKLIQQNPETNIALVFVGEGSEEPELKRIAIESGIQVRNGLNLKERNNSFQEIVFYPFQQYEITPLFYSLSEALVLPSFCEEWGLVVNEAMACGTAVIVSENAGCAADLVHDGKNGFVFNPSSTEQLKCILKKFLKNPDLSIDLGNQGLTYIQEWGPEKFSNSALKALRSI